MCVLERALSLSQMCQAFKSAVSTDFSRPSSERVADLFRAERRDEVSKVVSRTSRVSRRGTFPIVSVSDSHP